MPVLFAGPQFFRHKFDESFDWIETMCQLLEKYSDRYIRNVELNCELNTLSGFLDHIPNVAGLSQTSKKQSDDVKTQDYDFLKITQDFRLVKVFVASSLI